MSRRLLQVLCALDQVERAAQGGSPLHGVDARAKLIVTVVYLVAMLSVPLGRLSELLLFAVYPLIGASMGGLSYGKLFRRSLVVVPFAAFVGVFNLFYDREPALRIGSLILSAGWISFLSILLRGVLSVQALLVLVSTTDYYRLCRSMQRLGVPSLFTAQLLFVYRYLYVLVEQSLAMMRARDARSFGRRAYPLRVWGTLVGQLLIRTFERATLVGRAMSARGFTGRLPEETFGRQAWQVRDTVFLAAWCCVLVLLRVLHPAEAVSHAIELYGR